MIWFSKGATSGVDDFFFLDRGSEFVEGVGDGLRLGEFVLVDEPGCGDAVVDFLFPCEGPPGGRLCCGCGWCVVGLPSRPGERARDGLASLEGGDIPLPSRDSGDVARL
jgi:hypothetical protein